MEVELYKIDGTQSGEKVELPDTVFNIEPNDDAISLAVRVQRANSRQGTAGSKNRRLITGGGKKPWKQKGRGTARAGTSRSPVWVGGARAFGPQPRDYSMRIPKKVKKLARRSALTYKARGNEVLVVENFELENPKTKEMYAILQNLNLDSKKVLFLVPQPMPNAENKMLRASRNIPFLAVREAANASTYDILNCKVLLIQKDSIDSLKSVL